MTDNQPARYQIPTGVGLTAVGVAAARAAESRRDDALFDDPFAADFVAAAADALSVSAGQGPSADQGPSAEQDAGLWAAFFAYAPIRTRFFDDYFRAACAQGCHQVVIPAAGLDTRAFRLDWPTGVNLFELDTAEVLAFKDQVLAGRGATPACRLVSVSVDLRQDWPAALTRAGFHPGEPTAWLVEGLLLYLDQDEREHLFGGIGRLSAPGSWLAIEYVNDDLYQLMIESLSHSSSGNDFLTMLRQSVGQEYPTSWLERNGWQVHDYSAHERAQSYGRSLPYATGASAQPTDGGLVIARLRSAAASGWDSDKPALIS